MFLEGYGRRSRLNVAVIPDIHQLRLALGLSVDQAASLLGENRTLVVEQETGGATTDRAYVDESTIKYLDAAKSMMLSNKLPPMLAPRGVTSIYQLRTALGLNVSNAALVLNTTSATIELREDTRRGVPVNVLQETWRGYVDWAIRTRHRSEIRAKIRADEEKPGTKNPFSEMDEQKQHQKLLRLAYTPRPSSAEAEEFTLRFLDPDRSSGSN